MMSFVEKQLVSLDWDQRTLRLVHFVMGSKGGVRIRKVLSVALPPDLRGGDPVEVGQLIRRALERERIAAKRMVVDVPRDQAVLNTLRLPAVSDDDLPAMVEFQIGKELPFPLAAAAVDFAVANGHGDPNAREVLVAAVRQEVLEFYTQVAQAARLKLERVGLRPYANREAVNELLGDTRRERVLFVDVGPVLTEIDVLRDGALTFSRAASVVVPRASEPEAPAVTMRDLGGAEPDLKIIPAGTAEGHAAAEMSRVVPSLLVEVTRTIEAYRAGDPGASMDHVVVGGDTGVEDELLEAIKRRFAITGERYNPGACFGWDAESGMAAGGFAAALGLALGHAVAGRLDFDFAHPKKPVTRTQRRLSRAPMAAAVAILFIVAAVVGYSKVVSPQKDQIAQLEVVIADNKARLKDYEKFDEMVKKVVEFENESVVWVDELYDLLSVMPGHDDILINELSLDQGSTTINIKLQARGRPLIDNAVSTIDEFRLPGQDTPRFDATTGAISERSGDEYPSSGSIRVVLVNRDQKGGSGQ